MGESVGCDDQAIKLVTNQRGTDFRRVLLLGATGTIGRATARALIEQGHEVVCFVRASSDTAQLQRPNSHPKFAIRIGDPTDRLSYARDAIRGERFDAVVSCMASRTGGPRDAWAIDYRAHVAALDAATDARIGHFVLLSAICVQKPKLAFQQAKLAFEDTLVRSGMTYSIVRPTAFFKSLSGQIKRVREGKPYLLVGDGRQTACKPIAEHDLGAYLATCLTDPDRRNRVLPIGGPGPAITPREQGERLFALLDQPQKFRRIPIAVLDVVIAALATLGRFLPRLADTAEFARIGRYYATESMLALDPTTGRYDAAATPSTGTETLFDYYAEVVRGEAAIERGDHAVF